VIPITPRVTRKEEIKQAETVPRHRVGPILSNHANWIPKEEPAMFRRNLKSIGIGVGIAVMVLT